MKQYHLTVKEETDDRHEFFAIVPITDESRTWFRQQKNHLQRIALDGTTKSGGVFAIEYCGGPFDIFFYNTDDISEEDWNLIGKVNGHSCDFQLKSEPENVSNVRVHVTDDGISFSAHYSFRAGDFQTEILLWDEI